MRETFLPCRPEVLEVIEALSAEFEDDDIESVEDLIIAFEQDNLNPNVFSVVVMDEDGYANSGLVGWSEESNAVQFFCYDSIRGNHDDAEGVAEEDSRPFWDAKDLRTFILFLDGTVREIVREDIKRGLTEKV